MAWSVEKLDLMRICDARHKGCHLPQETYMQVSLSTTIRQIPSWKLGMADEEACLVNTDPTNLLISCTPLLEAA